MSIHPAVIIAGFLFLSVAAVVIGWVLTIHIQANANANTEHEYRLEQAERQRLEAMHYQIILAREQRSIAEVRHD